MTSIGFKPEIQGLRAIAVIAVLFYHIWPAVVPGGYVGVDVFFVISGYLITASLIKEAKTTGRINIAGFYARRIRRLLPASSLVLLAVVLCSLMLPKSQWPDIVTSIAASALYVQNWILAAQAVDYLAADNTVGPLKHFWSLSVEEQYYIVWPLLLSLLLRSPRWSASNSSTVWIWTVGGIGILSFFQSLYLTSSNPGLAYFATSTRVWELTLGGGLAISRNRFGLLPQRLRSFFGAAGLVCILLACFVYSKGTKFPGYAALLPTTGASLIIIAGDAISPWSPYALLRTRIFRYFGDISYSLYLWHWPVLFFHEQMVERELNLLDAIGILSLSCLLAHGTKNFVEDAFRIPKYTGRRAVALATTCIGAPLLAASLVDLSLGRLTSPKSVAVSDPIGATALTIPGYDWASQEIASIVPSPATVRTDVPSAYKEGCYHNLQEVSIKSCDYGNSSSSYKVVLIGDSHAAQWFPAFQELTNRRSMFFRGVAKTSCAFSLSSIYSEALKDQYTSCIEWSKNLIDWLRSEKPDIVLIAQYPRYQATSKKSVEDDQQVAEGMASAWATVKSIGLDVRAIRPTPWFGRRPDKCLSTSKHWKNDCVAIASEALMHDSVVLASKLANVDLFDFSRYFCTGGVCPVAIGNVVVYRDIHHMTATFAKTLSPFIEEFLFVKEISAQSTN